MAGFWEKKFLLRNFLLLEHHDYRPSCSPAMNSEAADAIDKADWADLGPRLQRYAHYVIARYRWRGLKVTTPAVGPILVNGLSADDFVDRAMIALVKGNRAYRSDLSLQKNLAGVIRSLISAHHKKSSHLRLVENTPQAFDGEVVDLIDTAADPATESSAAEIDELRNRQREMLDALAASLAGDDELLLLFLAYEDGKYLPAEIELATGIPAARVSELKRKLEQRADKFMRTHPQYADLKPLKEAK